MFVNFGHDKYNLLLTVIQIILLDSVIVLIANLELFASYNWPGNVRELQNEIERAFTLAGSHKEITEAYLSNKIFDSKNPPRPENDKSGTLQQVTERIEKQMVHEALEKAGGNRSHAASLLGITRQGLLNKIKRYNIQT